MDPNDTALARSGLRVPLCYLSRALGGAGSFYSKKNNIKNQAKTCWRDETRQKPWI